MFLLVFLFMQENNAFFFKVFRLCFSCNLREHKMFANESKNCLC